MSDTGIQQRCETTHTTSGHLNNINTRCSHSRWRKEAGCGKKYSHTEVFYLKLIPLAVYNKRLPGTILRRGWGGGGGHWPVRRDVCTFNIFFVILCNIFNPSKFFVYPTVTKDKTGNHQSHFNAHRSPSSQDERLLMKSVLTGQHALS